MAEKGLWTSDFRIPTSDFRLRTSDFGLPTSNFGLGRPFGKDVLERDICYGDAPLNIIRIRTHERGCTTKFSDQ